MKTWGKGVINYLIITKKLKILKMNTNDKKRITTNKKKKKNIILFKPKSLFNFLKNLITIIYQLIKSII